MLPLQKKLLTVLSVGHGNLTVVQGTGTRLDFCSQTTIDWDNEQKAREAVLALLPLPQRRQIGELCLVLPRVMFFTKLIHLPSTDEQELKKMANLQISQHLPYAPEQAVWDLVICGRRGMASDVLIMALQREAVMKYLRVLSGAGLFPTIVTVSSWALAGLLNTMDPSAHLVLFFPDEVSTEICFGIEGRFYFSRGIVYGLKDFKKDDLDDFFSQTRLTFAAQRKGFSQYAAPTGFYLTCLANGFSPEFLEQLTKESGIAWKELLVEDFRKKLGIFSFSKGQNVTVDAVAVIPFLRSGFKNLSNFLPKDFKERQNVKAGRKTRIALFLLVIGSLLSVTLAICAPAIKKFQQKKRLDEELKRVESPFLKLRKEEELWVAIRRELDKRISPLSFIEELYNSLPPGIVFSRIRISEQNELNIEGQALQSSAVNDFQEKMIAASLFHDVRLEHRVRLTTPYGEVSQFEITAKLQKPALSKGEK